MHTGIRPLARLMETELRVKLDAPNLRLDLSPLAAADVAGRARAIKAMIEVGIDPVDAARETGIVLTRPLREPKPPTPPPPRRDDDDDRLTVSKYAPRSNNLWTMAEVQRLDELRAQGASIAECARRLGRTVPSINHSIRKHELGRRHWWTREHDELVRTLLPCREVGEDLGRTECAVRTRAHRIRYRRRGPAHA